MVAIWNLACDRRPTDVKLRSPHGEDAPVLDRASRAGLDVREASAEPCRVMTELVTDAWTLVVPKHIARVHFDALGN